MKGYHYTTLTNYLGIEERGLIPSPIEDRTILEASSEVGGSWLFQNRQKGVALFGIAIERFAEQKQDWEIVELEIDFNNTDCLKALHEEDTLILSHKGSCGPWIYHNNEPIIVISKVIPACQITLLQIFDLENAIKNVWRR